MDSYVHHSHSSASFSLFIVLGLPVILYIFAAARQNRILRYWSFWRTASFLLGILLLCIALLSPLEQQAHLSFESHMIQHLLIGMFAPIALVLAKPVTLTLRSLPRTTARKIVAVLNTNTCHWIIHPLTTLLLNIGGMYALYLTPLYEMSLHDSRVHYLVHWHFLVAGYLFVWSLIEADPIPRRPSYQFRIFILFIGIAAHTLLAKLIYAQFIQIEPGYPENDIQAAAKIMYYGGDMAEIIVALLLFNNLFNSVYRRRNIH